MSLVLDGSNGITLPATTNVQNAAICAWANFYYTGSAMSIRASYNVTSVTFNSTGSYTLNFTNAISDANYACLISANFTAGTSWAAAPLGAGTKTTTQLQVGVVNNGAYADLGQISVIVVR